MNEMSKFQIGDLVRKKSGSEWEGFVCGTYSTALTPEGYAVESLHHKGSVQIYPDSALELCEPKKEITQKKYLKRLDANEMVNALTKVCETPNMARFLVNRYFVEFCAIEDAIKNKNDM